ncbi:MAG: hypothetical protein J07HQX50_02148 [Haloquadratum sp. J07HQX50]|jgi:hypothetical protein|nr:MAG: hypothetical protein J07HQX50_02148 [Haloquadratum sp. J07HQX50]
MSHAQIRPRVRAYWQASKIITRVEYSIEFRASLMEFVNPTYTSQV